MTCDVGEKRVAGAVCALIVVFSDRQFTTAMPAFSGNWWWRIKPATPGSIAAFKLAFHMAHVSGSTVSFSDFFSI